MQILENGAFICYIKSGGGCGNRAGRLLQDRLECCHRVCWRLEWYISCKQLQHWDSLSFFSRRSSSYVLPVIKETIRYFISAQSKIKSYQNDFNSLRFWHLLTLKSKNTYCSSKRIEITSIKQTKKHSKHREKIVYNNPCLLFIWSINMHQLV